MAGGGGGGVRTNFGDTAYFETVQTDENGTATVKFKLPDNVTTYRVTAHSTNEDLYLGVNTIDIVSKLDFFVQTTEPRGVKTTDDLVLNATSISEDDFDVEYEFTIKELSKTMNITETTNKIATVNFGKLPYGTYHATIKGKNGKNEDAIEFEFSIIESSQEVKTKTTVNIENQTQINPSKNPIVLEIYDKNMEQYLQYIEFLDKNVNERLDTKIAYNKVQEIKAKYYNTESKTNYIDMSEYQGGYGNLKNLKNGEEDKVLTALVSYYAKDYTNNVGLYDIQYTETDNIFEIYLIAAAQNKPVLLDLQYLREEKEIDNYNKLLITLSLEFIGDFQNAKELYAEIKLTEEEKQEYKSLTAIIETFIQKESAKQKINEMIEVSPADEYLRFAILSFFENNSADIKEESTVKIVSENLNETITINGMQVKTYTVYNENLNTIKFETESKDLMVSYYYQTLLDNIKEENITQDMKISLSGNLKKGNEVNLVINCNNNLEGEVRIALPNSLRLSQNYSNISQNKKYFLLNNQIDYVTFYKQKDCKKIEIPLIVTYEGNYKFENVVSFVEGQYHVSNSLDLNISE